MTLMLLLSVGAMFMAGLLTAYHFVDLRRVPKRLPRAPKPPNVRPEDLPRAAYVRVQPTIEDQDKVDWDARFKAWKARQKETIDADDPDLYEILERAAVRGRHHDGC